MKHSTLSNTDLREALVLGAALLGYSNGIALWAERRGNLPDGLFRVLNPLLIALMLIYAARKPGGLAEVGVHRAGLARSLAGGAAVGLGLAAPPLFFFYKPLLLDTPLEYGPISRFTRREMLVDVFLRVPVGIALLEELAFRGLLYAALRRSLPTRAAIAASAATFSGWHLMVTATSAAQTNLSAAARLPRLLRPYVQPIAIVGGLLTTGAAGLAFGALRERSGNLAGSVLAHWIVDGLLIATLWRRSQLPGPAGPS
jgi:uncharacterized protein